MNKLFTLRSLTIFSFVIFFLPFMRTCSDEAIKEKVELTESTTNEKNDFLDEGEKEIYTLPVVHYELRKKVVHLIENQ